jgi:ribonuclease HI
MARIVVIPAWNISSLAAGWACVLHSAFHRKTTSYTGGVSNTISKEVAIENAIQRGLVEIKGDGHTLVFVMPRIAKPELFKQVAGPLVSSRGYAAEFHLQSEYELYSVEVTQSREAATLASQKRKSLQKYSESQLLTEPIDLAKLPTGDRISSKPGGEAHIFTGITWSSRSKAGSWGVVTVDIETDERRQYMQSVEDTTNNRLELHAVIQAIQILGKERKYLHIFTVSKYLVDTGQGHYYGASNWDLIQVLEQLRKDLGCKLGFHMVDASSPYHLRAKQVAQESGINK